MNRYGWTVGVGVVLLLTLPRPLSRGSATAPVGSTGSTSHVDSEVLANPDRRPGEWLTHGRTYDEQRFSPLDHITDGNVGRLKPAWTFETGTDRGLEATPLVADGVVYTTGSWSVVYAVDALTGQLLWKWDPEVHERYDQLACCDVVNRGVALYRGRVYVGVLDGRLAALDARTGGVLWQVVTVDQRKPYTITGAPRIVKGLVIIGNGGAEYGVRGYVSAYDAESGDLRWRFYTVPGNPSAPVESKALASAMPTWTGEWWKYGGGGTVWDSMAYDADLDLLYVGTGNGSPWNRHFRSPGGGDNLYLSSILALDPDTGELAWHFQTTPGDHWDYTATQHIVLADLMIDGGRRRVLMQAPKNGFFYVLDRQTGALLSATPYVTVTWATGVDPLSGRPVEAPGADYRDRGAHVRPGPLGGHNWQPMSFNPRTGLVYLPAQDNAAYFAQPDTFAYLENGQNRGLRVGRLPAEARQADWPYSGRLLAWDPVKRMARWTVEYPNYWNGGTLTTAGNLVFQGSADGDLAAFRATDGARLWSSWTGTGIVAPPVTYAIGRRQFVAVMAGWGGAFPRGARTRGRLIAYSLDGGGEAASRPVSRPVTAMPLSASTEEIAEGRELFRVYCARCHGGGTLLPDLRSSLPGMFAAYENVLLKGTLAGRGMPSFAIQLSEREVSAVRSFVIAERNSGMGR